MCQRSQRDRHDLQRTPRPGSTEAIESMPATHRDREQQQGVLDPVGQDSGGLMNSQQARTPPTPASKPEVAKAKPGTARRDAHRRGGLAVGADQQERQAGRAAPQPDQRDQRRARASRREKK